MNIFKTTMFLTAAAILLIGCGLSPQSETTPDPGPPTLIGLSQAPDSCDAATLCASAIDPGDDTIVFVWKQDNARVPTLNPTRRGKVATACAHLNLTRAFTVTAYERQTPGPGQHAPHDTLTIYPSPACAQKPSLGYGLMGWARSWGKLPREERM